MAVTKTILKKIPTQASVKFVGTGGGTATLALDELALADETFDAANARVTITGLLFTVEGGATISRNNEVVVSLTEGQENWYLSQGYGFTIDQGASSNLVVAMTGNGTIQLTLSKPEGYKIPDRQLLQEYQR